MNGYFVSKVHLNISTYILRQSWRPTIGPDMLWGMHSLVSRLVTTRATQQQKLLVRLIIHPVVWGAIIMFLRHVGRHLGAYDTDLMSDRYSNAGK